MPKPYSYTDSVKSDVSDELVNVYLQRPIAGMLTRIAYATPVTPNHLTIAAIAFGLGGSIFLSFRAPSYAAAAGCFYLKDLLDSADGQLARAKQLYSRRGRFLDSIGDFTVNFFLFAAILVWLLRQGSSPLPALLLSLVGFLGVTLRVSYHVFYQTSFLHIRRTYETNRINEEFRAEDFGEDIGTVRLQRIFLMLYGWQDRLMIRADAWSRGKHRAAPDAALTQWYADAAGLRLSGFLGLGTEFVALTLCLIFRSIGTYLFISVGALNGVWLASVLYRRMVLAGKIDWGKK